jgi:hypothetical protein
MKKMMNKNITKNIAVLELMPNTFRIIGPIELSIMTSSTIQSMNGKDPDDVKDAVYKLWESWFVKCANDEFVSLKDLRYWDIDKQVCYAKPESVLIPKGYKDA